MNKPHDTLELNESRLIASALDSFLFFDSKGHICCSKKGMELADTSKINTQTKVSNTAKPGQRFTVNYPSEGPLGKANESIQLMFSSNMC